MFRSKGNEGYADDGSGWRELEKETNRKPPHFQASESCCEGGAIVAFFDAA